MTDNIPKSSVDKSQPKYRKALNREQLAVLNLLYTFRFASSEHVAGYFRKNNAKYVQKRLKILEDQQYIAKRYDKSYKLQGKPAAYYLLPKGARALIAFDNHSADEPINIKRLYKDKDVSEGFIKHCLNLLSVYLALSEIYGDTLDFFTKSNLKYEQYDYYPQPLPDTHFYLETKEGRNEYFLDIFEDNQPFFVLVRRIKKYLEYAGSGEWPRENIPTILIIADGKSVHKRLRKRIAKELRDSYDVATFATTRLEYLFNPEYKGEVWFSIDEYGDDPEEPREAVALIKL